MKGACQMLITTVCGFIQMYFPCGMYKARPRLMRPAGFYKHMILVGCTRFTTVVLGLISLNYVAVSFTETIKSSAPLFTVLISRYLLGKNYRNDNLYFILYYCSFSINIFKILFFIIKIDI